ncbi:hypothetical protein [Corynebacterium macginleyi]|uniref:hypothetical protein n=1 Tax=Corynebacterium macginleyi TaxID=38290 RepID=UPI00190BBBE5|nr:hypothetical protein [Corynebacterium macginleyi]
MPRKFDQDAKDRVVRLVEDRILAENMSMWAGLGFKTGRFECLPGCGAIGCRTQSAG